MNPRLQGDRGEWSAMEWFALQGARCFVPIGHSPHVDFVAVLPSGEPRRVQVKTSTCFRGDRWDVTLCTRGGNQSWNGIVKALDARQYDDLCIVVGDGRRWVSPSECVEAGSHVTVGGPKYAQYEVERGAPLMRDADVAPLAL